MSDDYRERMLAITEELRAQGVGPYMSAPPIYRLAWRLGLRVRPPLYQPFAPLALGMGIWFGVAWGLLMRFLFWRTEAHPLLSAVIGSLIAGTLFGLMMAGYYRWKAGRLRLPPLNGQSAAA
jgi:Family of unknown function (DUF6404)